MLTDVLTRTGTAGKPREYFVSRDVEEMETPAFEAYLRETMAKTTTSNGVFGFKIMSAHTSFLLEQLVKINNLPEDTPRIDILRSFFPDLRLMYLDREDILRQAISLTKAQITDTWGLTGKKGREGTAPKVKDTDYDATQIQKNIKMLWRAKEAWEQFFTESNVEPLRLTYSQLVYNRPDAIEQIYEHVDIDDKPEVLKTNHHRMADELSEAWYFRYLTESIDAEMKEAQRLERKKEEYAERVAEVDRLKEEHNQLSEDASGKDAVISTLRDELERNVQRRDALESQLAEQQREAQRLQDQLTGITKEINALAGSGTVSDPSVLANRVPWRVVVRAMSMKVSNRLGPNGDETH